MPESVPCTLVYAVPELVCEKMVTGETLSFLDKETEGQVGRGVKRRGRGGQSKAALGVDDKVTDEMEEGVETVLPRELWQVLSKKGGEDVWSVFELVPLEIVFHECREKKDNLSLYDGVYVGIWGIIHQ